MSRELFIPIQNEDNNLTKSEDISNISYFLLPGNLILAKDRKIIATVLGSCVAVCLWDPLTKVGGMNHFLLPFSNDTKLFSLKYGNIAMLSILEKILKMGVKKINIQAKVFGGGNVLNTSKGESSAFDVGKRNIDFAFNFLEKEKIKIINYDVGGDRGRKIFMDTFDFKVILKKISSSI